MHNRTQKLHIFAVLCVHVCIIIEEKREVGEEGLGTRLHVMHVVQKSTECKKHHIICAIVIITKKVTTIAAVVHTRLNHA